MLYAESPTESLNLLGRSLTECSRQLMEQLKVHCERVDFDLVDDLYQRESSDTMFFIESGILQSESMDRAVFYFEPGDLIGTHSLAQTGAPIVRSMEPVVLRRISAADFEKRVAGNPVWNRFLVKQAAFFAECCCAGVIEDSEPKTGFRRYKEGDVIIREGDAASEVYDLMSGEAAVFVEGKQVGEIRQNELFGAMAALTKTPRTATVIATRPCMVMTVPIDQFIELLRTQPRTGMALLENMSQKILHLNQQLVDVMKRN